jgi:hypothetical protein
MGDLSRITPRTRGFVDGDSKVMGLSAAWRHPHSHFLEHGTYQSTPVPDGDMRPFFPAGPHAGGVQLQICVCWAELSTLDYVESSRPGVAILFVKGHAAHHKVLVYGVLCPAGFVEVKQVNGMLPDPPREWNSA